MHPKKYSDVHRVCSLLRTIFILSLATNQARQPSEKNRFSVAIFSKNCNFADASGSGQ